MAEVDFGDSELFEQLEDDCAPPLVPTHIRFTDDDEEEVQEEVQEEERSRLQSRLDECAEDIERLTEENKGLRRKLNILTRPSGITIEDVNTDGPILQILYANNVISKKCRQEIEDGICSVILKHQQLGKETKKTTYQIKAQNSAFAFDEEPQKSSSSGGVKTTTESYKVVGSVLHFTTFSVDKLGQPLVNENPQMTDGWAVPTYHQVFNQVIGTDGVDVEMKDRRPKSICFNCGLSSHQMRDCPKPKDMAAINERRKEFNQGNNQAMQSNQRYHADEVEERFAKYKAGVMSEELLTALGLDGKTLPPLIYRMRQLGYPPGWLKEAEMENSGLALYDGNVPHDGNATDGVSSQNISYDVSKLVDFPGFNVPAPNIKDEFMQYGSIPMQGSHMKQNYAAYLSNNFPMPGANSNKRQLECDSSPQRRKKTRSSPDRTSDRSSDMDIESDPGTPYHQGSGDFQFQTPLPPGSPCFSSPPPLPQGTPPATPTPPPLPKGTPPPTPTNGSPALRGQSWTVVDDATDGTEDELSLEELEEQQRLIWAALENADTATNSDSETPATGTPVPSSPSVSTPVHVDTETEEVEDAMDTTNPEESCQNNDNQREPETQSPGPIKVEEDSPQSPEPVKVKNDRPQSPGLVKVKHDSHQSPGPIRVEDDGHQSPGPIRVEDDGHQSPGPIKVEDDGHQSPGPIKVEDDGHQSPGPIKVEDDGHQSPGPIKVEDDSPQSPDSMKIQEDIQQEPDPGLLHGGAGNCASPEHLEKIGAVPHRSNFAAGIVQFEDTPEFTEVAEATGTYLKIRDLLKSSPRNLAKKK